VIHGAVLWLVLPNPYPEGRPAHRLSDDGLSLLIGTPFFIFFGWLSDRIGRLKIILAGCIIAALTYFPLFAGLTHYVNPDLERFQQQSKLTVTVDRATCQLNAPWNIPTPCDSARDLLTKAGLSFTTDYGPAGAAPKLTIASDKGTKQVEGYSPAAWNAALLEAGYPHLRRNESGAIVAAPADASKINWWWAEAILTLMVIYVTMVYGPIAAFLVEMFPTKIRYTSMSLAYHIGNGWFDAIRNRAGRRVRQHLCRPLVADRRGDHDLRNRVTNDVDIVEGSGVEANVKA
jgi:hypothetical protein